MFWYVSSRHLLVDSHLVPVEGRVTHVHVVCTGDPPETLTTEGSVDLVEHGRGDIQIVGFASHAFVHDRYPGCHHAFVCMRESRQYRSLLQNREQDSQVMVMVLKQWGALLALSGIVPLVP